MAYGSAADAEDLANLLTRYRTAGLAWPVQYYLENRMLSPARYVMPSLAICSISSTDFVIR